MQDFVMCFLRITQKTQTKTNMKIHKDDNVKVIAGKDKGKTGKVLRTFPRENKVIIQGVNVQKHHEKSKKDTKQGGGIVEVSAPIHVSNVQLIDPKSNKVTRIGVKRDETTKKNVRYAKKSNTVLK
jgi:large subunit ribosomal protein L24